jgi:hypothetical protein
MLYNAAFLRRLGSTIQFYAIIDRLAMLGRRSSSLTQNEDDPTPKRFWLEVGIKAARYVILLILACVFAWRILWADFSWIRVAELDFSQVLTLLLALFSIFLSSMFYFRATQTSNDFYNQTYEFTKDFVDRLTRIEERFGELLKGIQEDTSRTRDYMQSRGEPKTIVPTEATGATGTVPPDKTE